MVEFIVKLAMDQNELGYLLLKSYKGIMTFMTELAVSACAFSFHQSTLSILS